MKKLGIVLGAIVALILAAMIIIPMVVNVDKYRPQIVEAANHRLNGHVELGHLTLSLWGHIRVEADGLTLKDAQGATVINVNDASFYLPFMPLLTGSPVVDLRMDNPKVMVVKNRAGKLNLTSLMKASAESNEQPQAQAQVAPHSPTQTSPQTAHQRVATNSNESSVAVPAILARGRLGFQLLNALVTYKDETSGTTTDMKDFNLVVKDLSLSRPSEISAWSDIDTHTDSGMSVKGPARIDVQFSPEIAGGKLSKFSVTGNADFDSLEIKKAGLFEKKSGIPANVALALSGDESQVKIDRADAHFFNAEIRSNGLISDLQTKPVVQYNLKSNNIELKSWGELIPMLREYELGGKANLTAEVSGPAEKVSYKAKIGVNGLTAKSAKLKSEPRIDGSVTIATDQIENLDLSMKAPGNDLEIRGKMLSFLAPQLNLEITSTGMDLDRLINFQNGTKTAQAGATLDWIKSAFAAVDERPQADYDAMLSPIRASKILEKTVANVGFNLRMLKAQNVRMDDVAGKLYLKDLVGGLQNFNMKIFNGAVKANASSQLRPRVPTYKFSATATGLDLGEAVKSQVSMFKNTVVGRGNFSIAGEGASFNPEQAKANLRAKGSMKISDAQFSSIDVGKMVTEALNNSISKIASKVPALANKRINGLPNGTSKYQLISSDFGISGGVFSAPNFVAKAVPNQGVDLKGTTTLNLKDQAIKANWDVIDTYNVTRAKDISADIAGTQVPHILAEGSKPVTFPVSVGCTLKEPCYSYAEVPEYLGKVAMANLSGVARNRIKSQIGDQIKKALGGNGKTPDIGGALKGLFGH